VVVYQSHVGHKSQEEKFMPPHKKVCEPRIAVGEECSIGPAHVCLRALLCNAGDTEGPRQFIAEVHRFLSPRIYNEVAKSSREHDQWRLSMMLSSFPVVVRR
jgi:hypothetical protein